MFLSPLGIETKRLHRDSSTKWGRRDRRPERRIGSSPDFPHWSRLPCAPLRASRVNQGLRSN